MIKLKFLIASVVLLVMMYSQSSYSEEDIYFQYSIGVTRSTARDVNFTNYTLCDDYGQKSCVVTSEGNSKSLGVGYNIYNYFSLEISKVYLGEIADFYFPNQEESKYLFASQETEGIAISGVIRSKQLFRKLRINITASLMRWDSKAQYRFIDVSTIELNSKNSKGNTLSFGMGGEYKIVNEVFLIANYIRYRNLGNNHYMIDNDFNLSTLDTNVSLLSVGLKVYM